MQSTTVALEYPDIDLNALSAAEKKELLDSALSVKSVATDDTAVAPDLNFRSTKTLHINAVGIPILRFPLPSSELEIPVYASDGDVAYISKRAKKSSGNAVLTDPRRGELISSSYRFGPGRDPVLHVLTLPEEYNEIKVTGKWLSRSHGFVMSNGNSIFTWRYRRERVAGDKKKKLTLLVMEVDGTEADGSARIAQLVRDEETRTAGSKSCSAGNGGDLSIDESVMMACGISEEIIVATCLMMLKKEIDRRRMTQMMVLAAAASGGS
jgi:hypothetical protein